MELKLVGSEDKGHWDHPTSAWGISRQSPVDEEPGAALSWGCGACVGADSSPDALPPQTPAHPRPDLPCVFTRAPGVLAEPGMLWASVSSWASGPLGGHLVIPWGLQHNPL